MKSEKSDFLYNVHQSTSYKINGKTYHSFEDIPEFERKLLLESGLLKDDHNPYGISDNLEIDHQVRVDKFKTKRINMVVEGIIKSKKEIRIPEMSLKSQIFSAHSLRIITSCLLMCLFCGWALGNKMNGPKGGLILFCVLIAISSFMSIITCNEELKSWRATGYRMLILKYNGNKFAAWLSIINIFLCTFCVLTLLTLLRNI